MQCHNIRRAVPIDVPSLEQASTVICCAVSIRKRPHDEVWPLMITGLHIVNKMIQSAQCIHLLCYTHIVIDLVHFCT